VVAVVPAYQPGPNLTVLVRSLLDQTSGVVVVDDGSPTPSDVLSAAEEQRARVIRHDSNRGIAAALNTGIREAMESAPTAVLTVDQDSEVPDGYIAALMRAWTKAEQSGLRVGLVAPEHVSGLPDQRSGRVPVQSGLLIPSATLRQVGEFDESLVIDGVDDDFALRCLDSGLALLVAHGTRLGHRLGETHEVRIVGRTVTLTRSAPFRYYYLTRNRIRLVRRYGRRHPGWSARQIAGVAGHLGLVLVFDPGRADRLREAWRGTRAGLSSAPDTRP
jgi:rhamnosyltransferase